MEELGLFEGKEDRDIPLKYSDRSKTPIEPYLSDQWFVKMGDRDDGKPGLAQMAMDAVTSGRVKFFPERYAQDVPRLARREARLVHQPATLVGAPDSGLEARRQDSGLGRCATSSAQQWSWSQRLRQGPTTCVVWKETLKRKLDR